MPMVGITANLTSSSALVRLMHVHMCNAWFGYLVTVLRFGYWSVLDWFIDTDVMATA